MQRSWAACYHEEQAHNSRRPRRRTSSPGAFWRQGHRANCPPPLIAAAIPCSRTESPGMCVPVTTSVACAHAVSGEAVRLERQSRLVCQHLLPDFACAGQRLGSADGLGPAEAGTCLLVRCWLSTGRTCSMVVVIPI